MHSTFIEQENMTAAECFRLDLNETEDGKRLLAIRDELYNSLTDAQKEFMDTYEDKLLEHSGAYYLDLYDLLSDRAKSLLSEIRWERAEKKSK